MSIPAEPFDVVVVGGGPAGIAAALAAAREGAHTLLVEREDRLGGNTTHALVHTICGLYRNDRPRAEPVHPGLPSRLATALCRAGAADPPQAAGRVFYLPLRPAAFAALAARWCGEAPGLALRVGTTLRAAELPAEPGEPARLTLDGPEAPSTVRAKVVVDTSGDAAAAFLAGAATEMAPAAALQRPSFIVRLEGVETDAFEGFARLRLSASVARATRQGALPRGCESVVVRPEGRRGSLFATLTLPLPEDRPWDPLDPACLEATRIRGRERAEAVAAFLRATRPGFARARVAEWPARVGIRETRRLAGRVVMTREEVLAGRRRDDEVARSAWPVELWEDHRRPRMEYPEGVCSVPLGALLSRTHPRLAAAGRCLSATHEALGALRVIGTALATGEAAGVAAALAADADSGLDAVAPARVRARIEAHAEGAPPCA